MGDNLSSYLLDASLVDYTTAVVSESLRDRNNATKRKRASLALAFFESILDPSKDLEKAQLDIFSKYSTALQDTNGANPTTEELLDTTLPARIQCAESDFTPAQRVLTLPDTLNIIFSHINTLSKSTRDTLHAASLTSTSMYYATRLRLWRHPRDLNTVDEQVRFAFGISISAALGDCLGGHVRRLRIRVMKSAFNARLVTKILELCPSIVDLTMHWGESEDGIENITSDSAQWLTRTLALLPNLMYLNLAQYSYAQLAAGIVIPENAHLPFSKLKGLQIYGFHWYFDAIQRGLGSNLTSLDIGYGTRLSPFQIIFIARNLVSLTSLRFAGPLELDQLRLFVESAPGLERVDLESFDDRDQVYMAEVYTIIADLPALRGVSVSVPARPAQITQLAQSSAPLEVLIFSIADIEDESAVRAAVLDLLAAKNTTLKRISELSGFKLSADDRLIEAFAAIPTLEKINITFETECVTLSDIAVEKLLTQCPRLTLTDGLEALVAGRAFYEAKYKAAFKRAQVVEEEELAENILAN